MATIILELDTELDEDIAAVRDAVQAIAGLISFNSLVHIPSERSTALKAREIAETVTLSEEEDPELGYTPVIEDIDQLAAFIDDGIRSYLGLSTGVYEGVGVCGHNDEYLTIGGFMKCRDCPAENRHGVWI